MDNKIYIYIHGYAEDKLKEVILNAIAEYQKNAFILPVKHNSYPSISVEQVPLNLSETNLIPTLVFDYNVAAAQKEDIVKLKKVADSLETLKNFLKKQE